MGGVYDFVFVCIGIGVGVLGLFVGVKDDLVLI